jgi:intraflagellar transport protein 88
MRGQTGMLTSSMGRPMTGGQDGVSRPMTGIRGAGYPGTAAASSAGRRGANFDPLNQAAQRNESSPGLDAGREQTPEDKIKALEKKVRIAIDVGYLLCLHVHINLLVQVNELIEDSCMCNHRGDVKVALDRAKEASTKERSLIRLREQAGLTDSHNLDLTFSVLFNLANQYAANEMYTEALNTYQVNLK